MWWLTFVGVTCLAGAWLLGWDERRRDRKALQQFQQRYGFLYDDPGRPS